MKIKTSTRNGITSFTVTIDPTRLATGHNPHRSGAGKHADKRTKRARTRGDAIRRAMAD